jgi:cytochrome c oxidase cbb3-type subunit 3
MTHKLFGLAAAAAVSLSLLTGCPAEERTETTTTTTTTVSEAPASPAATALPSASASASTQTAVSPGASAPVAAPAASTPAGKATPAGHVDAKAIFSQKCAGCHGANGGGAVGPALSNVDARGDAHIKEFIVNGSPNKVMPAFGQQLKPEEVDALVTYVKTL